MSATTTARTAPDARHDLAARRRQQAVLAPSAGTLRLTRRGRVVAWLLGAALAAGVGGAALSAQADGPVSALEVQRVVVGPGDTLWAIAAEAAEPGEDVRDVVLDLMALNQLPSGGVHVGQTVVVPVR